MKNNSLCILSVFALLVFSCNSKTHEGPINEPSVILSNYNNFWSYWYNDVRLSDDFIAYNENDSAITKELFLKKVATGNYLPLKLKSLNSLNYYKLYNTPDTIDNNIKEELIRFGKLYYQYFQMEGKPLPGFNFVDLNRTVYNPETCKGKIVVLNFWFIHCTSCVAEMPALNHLVDSYKDNDKVLFVSLALDAKNELEKFLSKTKFNYAVVPDKGNYLTDTFKIFQYPTHVILNKEGFVSKIPENNQQLEIELKEEILK